jgi:hypothetical protein
MDIDLSDITPDPNRSRPVILPPAPFQDLSIPDDEEPQDWDGDKALDDTEEPEPGDLPVICQTLRPKQRIALRLVAQGWTYKDVAKICSYHNTRVSVIANSERGKAYIRWWLGKQEDTALDAQRMLGMHSLNAAATLVEIMNDRTVAANTRLAAAVQGLDRSVGKPTERKEVHVIGVLGPEDIERMARADAVLEAIETPAT